MEEQIEQIARKEAEERKQQMLVSRKRDKPFDEQALSRLEKVKKFTLHDSSIPTERLNNYFCSLCGRINIVTSLVLQMLPKRNEDGTTVVQLKGDFFRLNLQRDKIKHVRRESGLQIHNRWKCECGVPIGYSSEAYEQIQALACGQQFTGLSLSHMNISLAQSKQSSQEQQTKTRFYIYPGSLIDKMKDSKLISEIITYKETVLLHLKKKTRK